MIITFDLEGRMEGCAFFALYAGLRMYKEQKEKVVEPGAISTPAAEAYCMLRDLEEQHPVEYKQAGIEFQEVYGEHKKN